MTAININQKLKRVEVSSFEINNEIVFNYFSNLKVADRDNMLFRSIYIGVLALMEDRISAFLSKTTNELGTELESLKMIFEMKKELFYKSSVKGSMAEEDIAEFLNEYFKNRKLKDEARLTGNEAGRLQRNKTGDILCFVNGNTELKISIECKFDKSVRLGAIDNKDIYAQKTDTAWSQLIESDANRDSKISLIVFDRSFVDGSILNVFDNVGYIPSIGFIAIIDSQKNDYTNLAIAYMLARDIALKAKLVEIDKDLLAIIVNRLVKDIGEVFKIRSLVETNIENSKAILSQLEKSLLLMEFNQEYLKKFLSDGVLTKKDLLDFYMGDDIKDKYKLVENRLKEL